MQSKSLSQGELDRGEKSEIFRCIFDGPPVIGKSIICNKVFFFTPFSSIAQLEFVGNPEFCH